jgi:hypothetical protein
MSKYAEGNVPYTGIFNSDVSASEVNAANLQLATILGPQPWNIPMVGGIPNSGWGAPSGDWNYYEDPVSDPPYWMTTGQAVIVHLNFPIPFARKNFKMTRLYCVVSGNSAAGDDFDGYIKLRGNVISAAGAACAVDTTISAQPWRTAAAWTLIDSGALAITFDGQSDYRLLVASCGDATARTCKLLGAYATIQLGA